MSRFAVLLVLSGFLVAAPARAVAARLAPLRWGEDLSARFDGVPDRSVSERTWRVLRLYLMKHYDASDPREELPFFEPAATTASPFGALAFEGFSEGTQIELARQMGEAVARRDRVMSRRLRPLMREILFQERVLRNASPGGSRRERARRRLIGPAAKGDGPPLLVRFLRGMFELPYVFHIYGSGPGPVLPVVKKEPRPTSGTWNPFLTAADLDLWSLAKTSDRMGRFPPPPRKEGADPAFELAERGSAGAMFERVLDLYSELGVDHYAELVESGRVVLPSAPKP